MMGLLDRFRKRKTEACIHEEVDMSKSRVVNDANVILEILRNTLNYSSVDYNEIKQKFIHRLGNDDVDERIEKALRVLSKAKLCSWGGSKANSISFDKQHLPLRLPIVEL